MYMGTSMCNPRAIQAQPWTHPLGSLTAALQPALVQNGDPPRAERCPDFDIASYVSDWLFVSSLPFGLLHPFASFRSFGKKLEKDFADVTCETSTKSPIPPVSKDVSLTAKANTADTQFVFFESRHRYNQWPPMASVLHLQKKLPKQNGINI